MTVGKALASSMRPPRGVDRAPRRILIAHNLLLGDTILLAPLMKALAARHPAAERVVLVRPGVAPLFGGRPYGTIPMTYERRDPASQRAIVDSGPYDLAIVPDDNRYAWLAKAAGATRVIAFARDRPAWKNAMVDRAVPYPQQPSAWADFAVRLLDADGGASEPPPFAAGEWPAPIAAPFALPDEPYAVLHVGASTALKQWPAERWSAIARRLRGDGLRVVWSGGAGERAIIDAVATDGNDVDLVGALDIAQLWHLLARARLLVCPDTGVAHLARVVGVPTVALFGPGSTVVHGPGNFWRDAPFHTVTAPDFPCRDQRTLYRRDVDWVRRCGRRFDAASLPAGASGDGSCGRPMCMEAIETATVQAAIGACLR